jgi:4-amino-4-deoxy-L-arabinose transferase-like glycosyltransferase
MIAKLKRTFSRGELIFLAVLGVLLLLLVWRYGSHTATLLAYPYEWDDDEGYHIYFARCLLQGQPIYGDINQLPMLPQSYPPVHSAMLCPFVAVFGANLVAGRLLSLLAVAGLSVLVLLTVRRTTNSWSFGILAASLVLGSPYLTAWGPLCRVDSLMLFLVFAGLFLVWQYPRSRAGLVAGIALLVVACYAKQQALFLTPAAFIHIWKHNRRAAVISVAAFAMAGLAILVLLQAWSGGHFWNNVVTAQATDFQIGLIITRLKDFLNLHPILALGGLAWVTYQINRRSLGLWEIFALSTLALVILSGKNGAGFHYFLPAVLAASLCSVFALESLLRELPPNWRQLGGVQVLLLLPILQALLFWLEPIREPREADRQAGDKVLGLVRKAGGDCLIERRAMFSVLSGQRPQADFCLLYFLYHQDLERAKDPAYMGTYRPRWDSRALVQAVREKKFPLVVIEGRFIPEEVLAEINANYQKLEGQDVFLSTWYGGNTLHFGVPKTNRPASQP